MYDEVRCHVPHFRVDLLWLEDGRAHGIPSVVRNCFEHLFQVFPKRLIVFLRNHSLRLTTFYVQKHATVVPPFTPRLRPTPIHIQLTKRSDFLRSLVQDQQPVLDQPLVHAEPTVQRPSAVIRHYQHDCVFIQQFEHGAEFTIYVPVIVPDYRLVRIARLVLLVSRVVMLPESVVNSVHTDLDKLEIIPLRVFDVVTNNLEVLAGHIVNRVSQPVFVPSPKSLHINRIVANQRRDLVFYRCRVCVHVLRGVRRQHTPYADTVHFPRRKRRRNSDQNRPAAFHRDLVPNRHLSDRPSSHDL